MYGNINTQIRQDALPTIIGATLNPSWDQCSAIGWRLITEVVNPPEGMVATAWNLEALEGDINNCKDVCVAWYDPVEEERKRKEDEAKRRQDKIDSMPASVKGVAQMYRALLRGYFGANAETNHAVTRTAVTQYFVTIPDITVAQLSDATKLREFYTILTEWWGTDNTWDFPWEAIP